MNDIYIQVDTKTAKTECENRKIGVKHANLQNKLIFKMTEKIIGNAWLEYEIDGDKNYAEMEEIEDGYQIIIKSCLLISDYVNVDLKITETENANGIPIFISTKEKLEVYDSINASKEEPEYYPDWKTVADSKIAEMNELKADLLESAENGDFDGATFLPSVNEEGDISWSNNKGLENPETMNIKGPKGDCNFATFEIDLGTGNLIMNKTDDLSLDFIINNNGELEVIING